MLIWVTFKAVNFLQGGSLYILGALTVDRYFFIKNPLHYPMIMTPARTLMLILLALSLSLAQAILSWWTIVVNSKQVKILEYIFVFIAVAPSV